MSVFVLDVFGVSGKRLAVLSIDINGGWDLVGGGYNTGGSWEWNFVEGQGFSIVLNENKESFFAFVGANWSKLPNPEKHPPKPWFSVGGVNSGTLTIVVNEPSLVGNWKLRMSNPNWNKPDWRPKG